jgi:putative NADH-flavin reductase
MKLTIFGATGGTGQELVKQALAAGHEVTAYARSPQKLNIQDPQLRVVQGEMDQPDQIRKAIAGADAVLSGLGPTNNRPGRPLTHGIQHIITGMQEAEVTRLIIATGAGVADPQDKPQLIEKLFAFLLRLFARNVLADSQGMVAAVRRSDLEWTLARAPRLNDKPGGGELKVGYAGKGPGTQLARKDFARFMLAQLTDETWVRKAPMLSN